MELCTTYFKYNSKIINGWKIIKNNNTYEVYMYSACKKLNNWQLFLSYNNKKSILKYFSYQVKNSVEQSNNDEWCIKEIEWCKNTYKILKEKLK